ncbi:MAG: hypothetical protein ACREIA_00455 [Opitutaceae bacterium]
MNLKEGSRAYLIVPHSKLEAARQMATDGSAESISIVSIEP